MYNVYTIILCQVEEWMAAVDFDNDGLLSYDEFKFSIAGNLNMRDLS